MLVDTVRIPGAVTQLTETAVVACPPGGTLTVRGVPPLTVQFEATPEMATVWLPPARFENVTPVLLLIAIGWPDPPSTATVYPSGSRLDPVVLVVTVQLPAGRRVALRRRRCRG